MKCIRCTKEISRSDSDTLLVGIDIQVSKDTTTTEADIEYMNKQLGKYSDGNGGCHVQVCYECYIDKQIQ
uniref:Uncharacterized protein n=1 Tax=viral metagenome TaxID=1070528 RepID=A0A6M3LVT4_9ZZZZ